MTRALPLTLLVAMALLACSDDTTPAPPSATASSSIVESTTSTAAPQFSGDPDSAFCAAVLDDRPVLDPFESGLDAREVELRLRALVVRADQLAAVAPPDLTDDVAMLADGLTALDEALDAHGYDFGAAGAADADLSFLDSPEFTDVGVRVAAYRDQVCAAP